MRIASMVVLVLLLTGLAGAESAHFDCTPSFPPRAPWQGADAAYSIPLPDGRVLWIFGDTLYGDKRQVNGNDPRMVHNTIGLSTCEDGKWKIEYVIKRGRKGEFDSFFKPRRNDGTYYWALDGVEYNHELWITLVCVRNKPNSDAFALGFEICGTDLARVTGLDKDAQKWKVSYFPLVEENVHANPSASALIEGDYLYIFTLYERASRPQILTRIPLRGLGKPKQNLQYLGSDNEWHHGLEPAKAKVVMNKGASEMSVRHHPDLKKWVAVLVDPQIFSAQVLLRTAPSMTGPWTEGDVIYNIPILQKSDPHYDADTFCYAGKEHPEFEKPGELLFTYVCNSMKPKKLEAETNVYFPQVVRMPMPEAAKK
ncbi:MAG TPA: DUF4185 domain-containing protein [Terriglobia bacterium]|nr:DUF4185 domain-containing protein [Terriglobia bacterium]